MEAGKLKEQIVIQSVTDTIAASGAVTESWATFATVRAQVDPITLKEYFSANHVTTGTDIKFRIRYLTGVLPKMRILWDSNYYDIQSIINVENADRELIIIGVRYEH